MAGDPGRAGEVCGRGRVVQIKTISVSYGETQSLPDYCNVKLHVTLTAELAEGEVPGAALDALWELARADVQEQVDQALESNGQPARYSAEPRYRVFATRNARYFQRDEGAAPPARVVVIVPAAAVKGQFDNWYEPLYSGNGRYHRYGAALHRAVEEAAEKQATLINCADGDLSKIPTELLKATDEPGF